MAIYKDEKRGTYYFSVYVTYKDGERKRILRRGFKTSKEAQLAEAKALIDAKNTTSSNPKMENVLKEYIKWYEKRRKESTTYNLKGTINRYILPFFEGMNIKNVVGRDIMKFHDYLLDNLAVTTSKAIHRDLVAFFNYAIRMEYVEGNPASEVGNITVKEDRNVNFWTLQEFKKFLTVVDNQRYRAMFMLLFYSGARIGEVLALTWSDVDFEDHIIDINKRYYRTTINTPKNKSSVRKLKIPNHTVDLIKKLYRRRFKDDYFIFGEFYKPLNQSTVSSQFHKYLDRFIIDGQQTLKRIRLHDFRHSHASYLINRGYDIQIVSKRLGHSKVSTTYDIYSHLYPNKEDEAILDMENDFKPAEIIKLQVK